MTDKATSPERPDNAFQIPEDQSLHPAALDRHQVMETFWSEIWQEAREDDRFMSGDQWPQQTVKERKEAGRPILTYNRLPALTAQITNKVRQERPQLRIMPVETDRHQSPTMQNVQGTKDYSMSDVFMGTVRNIEHVSRAYQAYDTALEQACYHGFGFFRLMQRYSMHDPFVQELYIKRVKDSYTVMIDPSYELADTSDKQDAFVSVELHKNEFKDRYPGAVIADFDRRGVHKSWRRDDYVTVAEYYRIKYVDDEVVMLSDGQVVYWSDIKDVFTEYQRLHGVHIIKDGDDEMRKPVKRPVVTWLRMSAIQILEGPFDTVFEEVPIFPVFGREMRVDGKTIYKSAINDAKDAQRSYNYWRTASAEAVALAPRVPWMMSTDQFEGHEDLYNRSTRENIPVLLYNHDLENPNPPQRNFPSTVAAAELAQSNHDENDMHFIVGLHEANVGADGQEKSGKAILARQNQGLVSTYHFSDNLNRAIEAMGRVLVQAIPRIYDTQRLMRIRMPDDSEDFVEVNKMVADKSGAMRMVNDISYGKYDVVIDTGPSYMSQRQESVEVMLELIQTLPEEVGGAIAHIIVKNMALPGTDEIYEIMLKMLPDELKSEEERAKGLPDGVIFDDAGNMVYEDDPDKPYEPEPTPEEVAAQQEAQMAQFELEARGAEAQAKIKTAEAKQVEAQAKITAAQNPEGDQQQGMSVEQMLPKLEQLMRTAIGEAMQKHANDPQAHNGEIKEAVADGMVDGLKRIRSYVDRQVSQAVNQNLNTSSGSK